MKSSVLYFFLCRRVQATRMKRRICVGLVTLVVLVVLEVSLSLAQRSQAQEERRAMSTGAHSLATVPWFIDEVDSPDVGEHVSVAIHPETGVTFVSYYDADGTNLQMATHVGSGGDCGPNNSWECQLVDGQEGAGDVGEFNSIAIYPGGHSPLDWWRLGIAYYDATNHGLKFAEYAYVMYPTPSYTWTISTIVTGTTGGPIWSTPGMYASLKYSLSGVPHIAYHCDTNLIGEDSVEYAYRAGSGGNCGPSNTWQCDTVATGEGMGQYTSLDLSHADIPWIAYYDADDGYPRVSHYQGADLGWAYSTIDQPSLDTGKHVSLVLGDYMREHIAYYNATSDTLVYAKYVAGVDANCGYNSWVEDYLWRCSEIENIGSPTGYRPVSIALDEAGSPIIAYQDASGGALAAILKVARPISALGPSPPPGQLWPHQ